MKKTLSQLFGVLTALASIAVTLYVIYQNWEKIRDFCQTHCPRLAFGRGEEFDDYVD